MRPISNLYIYWQVRTSTCTLIVIYSLLQLDLLRFETSLVLPIAKPCKDCEYWAVPLIPVTPHCHVHGIRAFLPLWGRRYSRVLPTSIPQLMVEESVCLLFSSPLCPHPRYLAIVVQLFPSSLSCWKGLLLGLLLLFRLQLHKVL